MGAILAAAVRMMNKYSCWTSGSNRSEKRLHHQVLRHPFIKGVADQFAIEQVLDSCQVKPAFISGHVRYVGDPHTVRSRYRKLPVEQVRGDWQVMPGIRGHIEFPFLPTAQSQFAANPFDAINASMNPV